MTLSEQFLISNAITLVCAVLLIVQMLQRERRDMFRVSCVSMGIMVVAFLCMECWSALVTTAFSLGLSVYEAATKYPRKWIRVTLSLLSALVAGLVQYWAAGLDVFTILPVVSAMLTGFGFCFSGSAGVMRVVQGVDSALWLVYDTYMLLFVCVFCDLVGLLMAVGYAYLQRFDPDDGFWEARAR